MKAPKIKTKFDLIKKILFLNNENILNWIEALLNNQYVKHIHINSEMLKRGMVVWMNFGVNIGNEFSGKHPALIINANIRSGDVYVLPIDSGDIKLKNGYCIKIPRVYGFKDMPRYVNLYRAQWLSVNRIDFDNRVGHIDNKLLSEIKLALEKFAN